MENLNYTAGRMMQVWPSRFPTVASAQPYAGNPRALANKVYNGRMGNLTGSDDGWNFRGRGASQTTGREGYQRLAKATGLDVVTHLDLVNDSRHFMECGVADFINCGCLAYAKADDVLGVTRRLNGVRTERAQDMAGEVEGRYRLHAAGRRASRSSNPRPPDIPKTPSIVKPSKGSVGAFIASILSAIFRRK